MRHKNKCVLITNKTRAVFENTRLYLTSLSNSSVSLSKVLSISGYRLQQKVGVIAATLRQYYPHSSRNSAVEYRSVSSEPGFILWYIIAKPRLVVQDLLERARGMGDAQELLNVFNN